LTLEGAPLARVEALVRPGRAARGIEIDALIEGVRVKGLAAGLGGDSVLEGQIEAPRLPLRLLRTIVSAPAPGPAARADAPVRGFRRRPVAGPAFPLAAPRSSQPRHRSAG